jgi:hypothetical protein
MLASILLGTSVAAVARDRCHVLCAPQLKIEPTFTIENFAQSPLVEVVDNGVVTERARATRETVFELIFALDVPTAVPRVGLTFEGIFKPFGAAAINPFTGVPAAELGRRHIRDNGVEIESELNFHLFAASDPRLDLIPRGRRRSIQPGAPAHSGQHVHAQAGLRMGHGVPCFQAFARRTLVAEHRSRSLVGLPRQWSTEGRSCAWRGAVRGRREPLVAILSLRGTARAAGALMW